MADSSSQDEQRDYSVLAFIEAVFLVAVSDGEFEAEEMNDLAVTISQHPKLSLFSDDEVIRVLHRCAELVNEQGYEARIRSLAQTLPTMEQRMDAISVGLAAAMADGDVEPQELNTLKLMQQIFGLTDEQIDEIVSRYQ